MTKSSLVPSILTAMLMLNCTSSRAADVASASGDCTFDRAKLLSLDLRTFDQAPEGWRSLAIKGAACEAIVPDLIAEYRKLHPEVLDNPNSYMLYWHEGQGRALVGQTQQAVELFKQSKSPHPAFREWNLYVDATLAFVRQDRSALLKARAQLAGQPPENGQPSQQPMNLDVVDRLISCFGRSYAEGYNCKAQEGGQ